MREVESLVPTSPLLAPRLNKTVLGSQPLPSSPPMSWVPAMASTAASSCDPVNASSLTLEEVAMAAAADTRARIRAAGVGLSPLVGGGLGFTESSLEGSPPMAPWAFVPVAPMAGPMYSWQWPPLPHPTLSHASPMKGTSNRTTVETLQKHRADLQHELADLRSRFHELQDSCSHLEKENMELKNISGKSTPGKLEETCRRQEQDIVHLKRALKEREEGEASLRRLFAEEQALSRNVLRENERLKHELSIMKGVPENGSRLSSRRQSRQSSSSGTTGSIIEVDLTGEL